MPVIGNPVVGTSTDLLPINFTEVFGPYPLDEAGVMTTVSIYLEGTADGPQAVRAVVYVDDDGAVGALLATSAEVTVGKNQAGGWVDFTLPPSNAPIASYWLGFEAGAGNLGAQFRYRAGARRYVTNLYPAAPSPFGAPLSSDAEEAAITATVDLDIVADLPDNTAAVAAGYTRTRRSLTQMSTTTFVTTYETLLNPPGQSPTKFGGSASSVVSQAAADTAALAALNANRRQRYAGSAGLPSGSLVVPTLHGDTPIPDVN